jgi:mycothiol synthase
MTDARSTRAEHGPASTPAVRVYGADDAAAFRTLLHHPSLAAEFGWLLANGELNDPRRHPFGTPRGVWVTSAATGLAGFASLVDFTSRSGDWTLLRVGVREPLRRLGLGRALATAAIRDIAFRPGRGLLKISHWEPNPAGEAFARALGFEHDRFFWTMQRPRSDAAPVTWPDGIEALDFDGSGRALQDWCDCSNAAFAQSPMSVDTTLEQCRVLASARQPNAIMLAYRDGRCIGFCRTAVHPEHGDVDVLGVAPEARRIGLGRALLRWGVSWLVARRAPNVRLMVDGENERALALYRGEGFEVVRSRRIWRRTPGIPRA